MRALVFLALASLATFVGCEGINITNNNDNRSGGNGGGGTTGPSGPVPVGLACVASACSAGGCSAITCTWTGGPGTICATSTLGTFCLAGRSPVEIDPGLPGVGGADWIMTLDLEGVTHSGGVVRTDT